MDKRKITVFVVLWILFFLCGCLGGGRSGGSEKEKKEDETEQQIVLNWAVWDREIYPVWDALKNAFEKENPNVKIHIKDLGNLGYQKVLMNDLLSGEEYDIITTHSIADYVMLCQKKQLLPLDYYIEREKIDLSQYNTDTENLVMNGMRYQLPFQNDFWVLFYNQDLFDRQRIEYPTNHMTLQEYEELVLKMTSKDTSKRIYGTYYHSWPSVVRILGLLGENKIPSFSSFNYLEPYYNMIKKQESEGCCQDYIHISTMGTNYAYAFSNGDIAMMPMGSWMIAELIGKQNQEQSSYQKWNGRNWGIVRMPRGESRDPYEAVGNLHGLSIHASSRYKETAWKFLQFACGKEGAKIQAECGNVPAFYTEEIRGILTGIEHFPEDETSIEAMEVHSILDIDDVTGVDGEEKEKMQKSLPEIHTIWEQYHKEIMSENKDISDGLYALEKEVKGLIEK